MDWMKFAEISNKTQVELTELEARIKQETNEAVILVAYEPQAKG